jgi:hypothetical protein
MKQGRGDDYIPAPLTSSNSGWHKGVVLPAEQPRARASIVHRLLHREVAKELGGRPRQGRAREDAQVPLGRAWVSSERRNHLGGGGRAVPCPRCCVAPEAATPALRHDRRHGPMGWGGDRAGASVAARGSALRGASDRESDLLVATVADALRLWLLNLWFPTF